MLNDSELLKLLPELLIEHFEIVKFKEENKILHIYFEEKNTAPKEFSSLILQSEGFVPKIMADDFPLCEKTVKLHIRRRRGTDTKNGKIIQRDWNLIAKGLCGVLKKSADTKAFPYKTIGELYGVDGRKFQRQYKQSIIHFKAWEQKSHAEDWILYPENLSDQLSLDEVAVSDSELYSVLTSKKAKRRKGSIVAIIKGIRSDKVVE